MGGCGEAEARVVGTRLEGDATRAITRITAITKIRATTRISRVHITSPPAACEPRALAGARSWTVKALHTFALAFVQPGCQPRLGFGADASDALEPARTAVWVAPLAACVARRKLARWVVGCVRRKEVGVQLSACHRRQGLACRRRLWGEIHIAI